MAYFFSLVRDVNPSTSLWAMRLRVVRAYQVPSSGNANDMSSYEIIFHDKENDRIHATIKSSAMKTLKTMPVEGCIYAVKDFLVADNRMKFKTTANALKIIFLRKTKMEEVFDETFPKSMFVFKSFKDLQCVNDAAQFELFDVIGKLKTCQISPTQTARGKRLEFEIQDLDESELSCTLWDDYADLLLPNINHQSGGNVVVIIQFGRVSVFGGQIKFSNTYNATNVVINGDVQEIVDFSIKLEAAGMNTSTITMFEDNAMIALADDFHSGEAIIKIVAELTSCSQASVFWVPATIIEVEVLANWFYLVCKYCSKKLTAVNSVYYCTKCVRTEREGNYRYKIEVSVFDKTGSARLILWDKECIELVGRTAAQVKQDNEEAFDYIPKEVEEALADKFALFKVQGRDVDFLRESVTYSVTKMTANDKILAIYNEKYVIDEEMKITGLIEEFETEITDVVSCESEMHDAVNNADDEVMVVKFTENDNNESAVGKKCKRIIKKEK